MPFQELPEAQVLDQRTKMAYGQVKIGRDELALVRTPSGGMTIHGQITHNGATAYVWCTTGIWPPKLPPGWGTGGGGGGAVPLIKELGDLWNKAKSFGKKVLDVVGDGGGGGGGDTYEGTFNFYGDVTIIVHSKK